MKFDHVVVHQMFNGKYAVAFCLLNIDTHEAALKSAQQMMDHQQEMYKLWEKWREETQTPRTIFDDVLEEILQEKEKKT